MASTYKVGENPLPFRQSIETAKGIASLAALPSQLMVCDRLGLNIVSRPRIIGLTLFMLGASWLGNLMFAFSLFGGLQFGHGHDESLWLFALLVFAPLALRQNLLRLREEKTGAEHVHTWSPGIPRLDYLPLSDLMIRLGVNPAVVLLTGAFLRYEVGAGLLGLFLMFSALSLFVVEYSIRRQDIEHRRDLKDRLDEGEYDAQLLRPSSPRGSNASDAALPTGATNDVSLLAEIERRRKQTVHSTKGSPLS
jgi:hypothetical protein